MVYITSLNNHLTCHDRIHTHRAGVSIHIQTEELSSRDNNIKIDLKEVEWEGLDWIHLAQDSDKWRAVVNMVMNLRDP
jgi:hypothetical protein